MFKAMSIHTFTVIIQIGIIPKLSTFLFKLILDISSDIHFAFRLELVLVKMLMQCMAKMNVHGLCRSSYMRCIDFSILHQDYLKTPYGSRSDAVELQTRF